uniref:Guanine nucleotide exchange factor MSS4 n=2 Tax=Melopsittacus undulatus TaxID=13146 RepID=A0A8C6JID3_MELUD
MEAAAAAVPAPSPPPSAAAAPGSAELVCAEGRNLKAVLCQRCGSRVLLPGAATFTRRELLLPAMRKKAAAAAGGGSGDVVREHWLVRDMFSFENVGFTRDVGNVKFLVCADCEAGPIGWHCLDDKDSFYVALERVAHE